MGIFEFEPSLHELKGIGDKNNQGYVYKMFEELQFNQLIEWIKVNELFTVVLKENKKLNYIVFHLEKRICFKNRRVWKR